VLFAFDLGELPTISQVIENGLALGVEAKTRFASLLVETR